MVIEEPVLMDTGPLVALLSERDRDHQECVSVAKVLPLGKVYTCWPVLTEAAFLLKKRAGKQIPEELFNTVVSHRIELLTVGWMDLPGIQDVYTKYPDQDVDLADAMLVHLAERENINAVFTLDRRHFRVYRRPSGDVFRLLPDDFQ